MKTSRRGRAVIARLIEDDEFSVWHYLGGGGLMGTGALLAGGCNIGQGLSGAATLSATSLLAVAGILAGMSLGMVWVSRAST